MLLGVGYVASGLVVTILGRQQWKSRRERRAAKRDGFPAAAPAKPEAEMHGPETHAAETHGSEGYGSEAQKPGEGQP
jgi:hypothetical protein